VPKLGNPASRPARKARPAPTIEPIKPSTDRSLVIVDNRFAVRRLVCGKPQRIQRERILIGSNPLLLDQATENPQLDRIRVHRLES
jgi:hypothetical protein